MSTIVVVRKGRNACIAADTLTSFGELRQAQSYEKHSDKIHRLADNYMGIIGSAAHHIVIPSLLSEVGFECSFYSRMEIFESFRKFHPVLKDRYFLNPKEEEDDPYESSRVDALLVNPHGVFGVYSLREVFEYTRFWAIGSGSEFALGAMFASYDRYDKVEKIARVGVEAGAEFNGGTALPLTLCNVRLKADN